LSTVVSQLVAQVSTQGVSQTKQDLSSVGTSATNTGNIVNKALSGAFGLVASAAEKGMSILKDQLEDSIKIAMQHQQVMAQTSQAIKSTGDASGMSATAVENLATSLSKVTDFSQDTTEQGENMLLTFTNIGKNVFPQTTQIMLDMAQAMHQGPTQTALELGKALNDPAQGLSALQRVGVTFSDQEKQQIQTMMSHNDVIGAQNVMLQELQKEFGGSAEAAGKTFGGQLTILKNNLDDFKEKIGSVLLPALSSLTSFVSSTVLPNFNKFADWFTGVGMPKMQSFGSSVGKFFGSIDWTPLTYALKNLGSSFDSLVPNIGKFGSAFKGINLSGLGDTLKTGFLQTLFQTSGALNDVANVVKTDGPAFLKFFENISPGVNLFQALSTHTRDLSSWFNSSLVPALKQAQPGFASLEQAIMGLAPVFEEIGDIVHDTFQVAFTNLLPVFEKLVPIIIQLSGIIASGLGAAIKFLTPYIEQAAAAIGLFADQIIARVAPILTQFLNNTEAGIKEFMVIWNAVWPILAPILKGVWDEIVGVIEIAWALVSGIVEIGLDALSGNWKQAWTDLQNMLKGVWGGIQQYLSGMIEIIMGIFTPLAGLLVGVWHDVQAGWSVVASWFGGIFNDAKNAVTTAFGNIGGWFTDRWHDIQGVFGGIGAWFSSQFTGAQTSATNAFSPVVQFFQGIWTNIQNVFGSIGAWFTARWNDVITPLKPIITFVQQAFTEIGLIIGALVAHVVTDLEGKWNQIVATANHYWILLQDTIQLAMQLIEQKIQSILQPIVTWIEARWTDVKNGVSAAWSWVSTTIATWWNAIYTTISSKINQVVTTLTGWYTTVKNGINGAWQSVSTTVTNWWNAIYGTISAKAIQAANFLTSQWTNIKNGVASAWSGISSTISTWWNNIVNTATSKVTTLKNNVNNTFTSLKTGIGSIIKGFIDAIITQLNNGITGVQNFLNGIGNGLNGIASALGIKPIIATVKLGMIPLYAAGTPAGGHPGGPAIFGEQGPEFAMLGGKKPSLLGVNGPGIADLPRGTSILPADLTQKLLKSILSTFSIPGYANGSGNPLSDLMSWIGGGAGSVLTNTLNALGIHGFDLPGVLNNLTGAVFSQIKTAATNWITSILPKFSFGSSPTSTPGNVQSWIAQAMSLTGAPASWAGALATIAMHESGGNPNAENDWDSNAAAGDPSRGLFQTIGSTFATYMLPGHGNILNPIDNAISAIRYIMAVYGSVFNTPGIVSMSKGGPYLGYANGTNFNPVTGDYVVGERGPEILRIPRGASVTPNSQIGSYNDNSQVIARLDRLISLMENGLTLDGQRLTRAQMPYIVSEIRNKTNTRF